MATTPERTRISSTEFFGTVRIDDRCTACGNCIITCPPRALLPAPGKPAVIDTSCTLCSACIEVCPVDAITEVVR
ncbi:MAG: 4Fe-4S binding protein [Actinomycetota bacterium]